MGHVSAVWLVLLGTVILCAVCALLALINVAWRERPVVSTLDEAHQHHLEERLAQIGTRKNPAA